jgi:ABC-type Co2+ transport system permease subunit
MLVPMVNIRIMRVVMQQFPVNVRVRVSAIVLQQVVMMMPVMLIVHVAVFVLEGFVPVLVLMAFGKMQPHSDTHEDGTGK